MPCFKGMTRCKASCEHRTSVFDYHIARHAWLDAEEALTCGDPAMIAERRAQGIRPITWKEWIVGQQRN